MNITTLVTFLSPFLPFLLKLGGKAVDKATETAAAKLGEASWTKAQSIWKELSPKIEAKEAAKEAVEDVVNHPDNEKLRVVLEVQLEKLLNDRPNPRRLSRKYPQHPNHSKCQRRSKSGHWPDVWWASLSRMRDI
jgi:hypothetical protein